MRVGFGPIGLPNRLKRGQFYELNPAEVANILKWAEMLLPGEYRRKKPKPAKTQKCRLKHLLFQTAFYSGVFRRKGRVL